jgi:hypothetical protein
LQDAWLTGQERQVRDEARTRHHQLRTQTVPLQHSDAPAPGLVQGIEPSQDQNDVAITEHSETDASEGAQQRTRSDKRVRPPNRMNLKTSIKFKGDNLRQYENGRSPEKKV